MSKKNIDLDLTHIIKSNFEEAQEIKKDNKKKEAIFQTRTAELRKQIRDTQKHLNDI